MRSVKSDVMTIVCRRSQDRGRIFPVELSIKEIFSHFTENDPPFPGDELLEELF